jgi:hypothetical protein
MIQRSIPLFLLSWTAVAMAQAPEFAAPVRIEAGAKLLGENRLYPSPMPSGLGTEGAGERRKERPCASKGRCLKELATVHVC